MNRSKKFDDIAHNVLAALEQSRVVRNRGTLLRARLFGIRGQLRFADGFEMPVQASNLAVAINLVRLSYFGASLTNSSTPRWGSWVVSLDSGILQTPEGIRFCLESMEPAIFAETFIHQIHFFDFDLTGKVVVDVGGFVGDTALFFANLGAKVIVYEPDPTNFSMLLRNIELNPRFANRITVWNKAVGTSGSLPVAIGLKGGSGVYASSSHVRNMPSVDLRGILEENNIRRAHILKIDSKGTEFDLLAQQPISQFDIISCEYSADIAGKSPEMLVDMVKAAGFTRVRVFKHNCFYYRLQEHGTIQACRAD